VRKYPARQRAIVATIRSAREEAGLTARALSLKLGEHHSFISRCERLQRDVSVAEFEAIAKACGTDPVALFKRAMR
jgi:transcriptional regulator with XRE-family HTH domain